MNPVAGVLAVTFLVGLVLDPATRAALTCSQRCGHRRMKVVEAGLSDALESEGLVAAADELIIRRASRVLQSGDV